MFNGQKTEQLAVPKIPPLLTLTRTPIIRGFVKGLFGTLSRLVYHYGRITEKLLLVWTEYRNLYIDK